MDGRKHPLFFILAWGLYDLANQFFALNIVSLYFVRWVTIEKQTGEIFYSLAFGVSTLLVAMTAPILGAISDITRRRRLFLVTFTLLSILSTMSLAWVENVGTALLFFAIANFGCQSAVVFYNALMLNLVDKQKVGFVSGIGKMLGYCGAIIGLHLFKPLVLKSGYKATFFPTGLLFLIFSLPCMILIKDDVSQRLPLSYFFKKGVVKESVKRIGTIFLNANQFPKLTDFLKAAFFCLCVVNILILFMSVYATQVFCLNEEEIITLFTFSTVFAIIGSLVSGIISDYFGHWRSLVGVFILWILCLVMGTLAHLPLLYWVVGAIVGVTLGSTWVISRAFITELVSEERLSETFGLFGFVGYASAIVGALFWGGLLLVLDEWGKSKYRIALGSLTLFMGIGLMYLLRLSKRGKQDV